MTAEMGVVLGILVVHSVMDIRRRKISLVSAGICLAAGLIWQAAVRQAEIAEILLSCLPGAALLGISRITDQKIGYGDGWIVTVTGVWAGIRDAFLILTGGMMACALYGGILLSAGKIRKGDTLPFLPFLLAGCIGRMIFWKM